jgi:hypothetical protein
MSNQTLNPFLVRRRPGSFSPFDTDKELAEFINGVDQYYSIAKLRNLLIERFGADRAPSKSALHRYIQKITQGDKNR